MDISSFHDLVVAPLVRWFSSLHLLEQTFFVSVISLLLVTLIDRVRDRYAKGVQIQDDKRLGYVYVFRDVDAASVYKVGFTNRHVGFRMSEVERNMTRGRRLRLVFAVQIPHARAVETVVHRRLQEHRLKSRNWLGNEWYLLPGTHRKKYLEHVVKKSVSDIQRRAKRQGRWPRGTSPVLLYR